MVAVTEEYLYQLCLDFMATFLNIDIEAQLALRSEDCVQHFAPASLNVPSKGNEDFTKHLGGLKDIIQEFRVFPKVIDGEKQIRVNAAKREVFLWANGKPTFKAEAKVGHEDEDWEYVGELIFVLTCNEEGKIERVLEFLDSKKTIELQGLAMKARANMMKNAA
ncbi:hypothetical protein EJ04DRAFT_517076 [Polyplosphaeria fusca]|uniref:SnoaL-like domain-containing protein n=1 Tax=Polyplosphaeria fusca TaxID=682080 RepID=A0A9P4UWF3_9PLEO|nr:hypothetical protein EJ04DRAFT_517076 [Polyplosphaeria fusca]